MVARIVPGVSAGDGRPRASRGRALLTQQSAHRQYRASSAAGDASIAWPDYAGQLDTLVLLFAGGDCRSPRPIRLAGPAETLSL